MNRRERQAGRSTASTGRWVIVATVLSLVAMLGAGAALGVALTRDSGANGCRGVAWNAVPRP